jgi:membrane-bound lytic murein transglycosylase D
MAAYNSGPGTVQRAVQRTGYADFWELYRRNVLPGETRNYVPIILAMTIMAKNPTQYGLDHLALDSPATSDTVRIHYPIDLRLVAECTDSSTAVLQELNPSLLRMTTPKDMDFDLHLPAGTSERFQIAVAAIPEEMRVYWRFHRVEAGETIGEIARRYRTTATAITEANNLEGEALARGSRLIIPVSPSKVPASDAGSRIGAQGYSKHPARYTVHKGDTVVSVADSFGVPAAKIRQWNRLQGNTLRAGQSLTIFKPVAAAVAKRTTAAGNRHRGASSPAPQKRPAARPPSKSAGKNPPSKTSPANKKSGSNAVGKTPSAKKNAAKNPPKTTPSRSKKAGQQG